jgi:Zn-dependent protease
LQESFLFLLIWVACVFLSILLHEFGHIWMGKLFGTDGYIVLYGFGGLAVPSSDVRRRWQRILVSLAGPAIQLVLYGLIWAGRNSLSLEQKARMSEPMEETLRILILINLFWPLLNLLPVWPLDGGQVSRELFSAASPRDGLRWSLILSIGVAAVLAVNGFAAWQGGPGFLPYVPAGPWSAILFALLAVQSYQLLQLVQQQPTWQYEEPDDRLPWER